MTKLCNQTDGDDAVKVKRGGSNPDDDGAASGPFYGAIGADISSQYLTFLQALFVRFIYLQRLVQINFKVPCYSPGDLYQPL